MSPDPAPTPAWMHHAACLDSEPDTHFPEKGGSTTDAKAICARCTVTAECLDFALANDERFGIWGGFSERERRRLQQRSYDPHQLAELAETQRQVNTVRAEQVAVAKRPPGEQRAALRTIGGTV